MLILEEGRPVCLVEERGGEFRYEFSPAQLQADEVALECCNLGSGEVYRVARDAGGAWVCSCGDFRHRWRRNRRRPRGGPCKHAEAVWEYIELAERTGEVMAKAKQELASDGMTPEQVDLIRRTICAGASDDELQLFLMQCKRTGLDPFSRQIHAVKRSGKMTIQVGIDGLRLVADRTGKTDGQDGPYWCGPQGVWKDVWLAQEVPNAAKVVVYRKGQQRGYVGIAHWTEYAQQGPMWAKMPALMLSKVAESLALRKAFPMELSGLYAPEEMRDEDHHEAPSADAPKHLPAPAASADAPGTGRETRPELPLIERLAAWERNLVAEGVCEPDELMDHLQRRFAPQLGECVSDWPDSAEKYIVKEAKAFIASRRPAADARRPRPQPAA